MSLLCNRAIRVRSNHTRVPSVFVKVSWAEPTQLCPIQHLSTEKPEFKVPIAHPRVHQASPGTKAVLTWKEELEY